LRIHDNKPYLIEIGARAIGGVCGRAHTCCIGENYYEIVLKNILGEKTSFGKNLEVIPSGVMMLPVPKEGIVKDISGLEKAKKIEGIVDVLILTKKGDKIQAFPKQSCYLGFIIAIGKTTGDTIKALQNSYDNIQIDID